MELLPGALMGLLLGAFAARKMCLHLVGNMGNPRREMCSKRRSPYVERCRLSRQIIKGRVQGLGFWVQGSGFRVQGLGFWVQGLGI